MTLEYVENIATFVLIAVFCLLVVIGILVNMFIVEENLNCWKKSQPLQTIDIIITSLAMVRIILLLLYTLFIINILSAKSILQINLFPEYTITLTLSVEFCSLWWGSVLCVFYCAKITNYSNILFIRLKMNISKMVPWLLLISVVLSVLFSLTNYWFGFYGRSFNGTDGVNGVIKLNWFNCLMIRFAGSVLPFVIICISIGLLIVSLLRHIRNLGSRNSRFSDDHQDIHISVIRNMISCLLCYIAYFLGTNLLPVSIIFKKQLLTLLCFTFYIVFPSLHSIFLIISNQELKNALFNFVQCAWIRDGALR